MPLLSIAIICKNNQTTIGRTLEASGSLAAAVHRQHQSARANSDRGVHELIEIVAVDSGSTDGTLALLESAGARIIRTDWRGYVGTKQFALEACRGDWILSLDSDESPEPELIETIAALVIAGQASEDAFEINRKIWYAGAFLEHAWQPEWRLRLVRRGVARWTGIDPHDKLEVQRHYKEGGAPSVSRLPRSAAIRHDCLESPWAFLGRQVSHSRLFAQGLFDAGKRTSPLRLATSPAGAFLKQLLLKRAWRDGWRGWVASACHAAASGMKHACLLHIQHTASSCKGRP
ncbi:MAG: glycosyltransferase family 2 protein [Planctomycetota bacterium]|nr:glycosyltransferase family 2 protein [Planctomycetota bacterium]